MKSVFRSPADVGELGVRLLSRVLDDPDDEAARLVYIDHLLEQHDPRGEYLHLSERLSKAQAVNDGTLAIEEIERMNELLTKHEDAWLGPLAHVTSPPTRRYYRGFLDACDLALDSPSDLDSVLGAPEWATLSRVERSGKSRASDLARLAQKTRMPRLRVLGPLDQPTVAELASDEEATHALEEISFYVVNPKPNAVFSQDLITSLSAARGLPRLKRLSVGFVKRTPNPFGDLDVVLSWMWRAPIAQQLEMIGVALDTPLGLSRWIASLEAMDTSIKELRILPPTAVGPPSLLHTTPGEHVSVRRGEGAFASRFSRLVAREAGYDPNTDLPEMLSLVPDDALTHIDVRGVSIYRSIPALMPIIERQRNLKDLILPKSAYGYGGMNEQQQATQMVERMRLRDVRITYVERE